MRSSIFEDEHSVPTTLLGLRRHRVGRPQLLAAGAFEWIKHGSGRTRESYALCRGNLELLSNRGTNASRKRRTRRYGPPARRGNRLIGAMRTNRPKSMRPD